MFITVFEYVFCVWFCVRVFFCFGGVLGERYGYRDVYKALRGFDGGFIGIGWGVNRVLFFFFGGFMSFILYFSY